MPDFEPRVPHQPATILEDPELADVATVLTTALRSRAPGLGVCRGWFADQEVAAIVLFRPDAVADTQEVTVLGILLTSDQAENLTLDGEVESDGA